MQTDVLTGIVGFLVIICGFMLVIGLIRPGFVVWWSDKKTRSSALAVWGVAFLVSVGLYWFLNHNKDDSNKYGSSTATYLNRKSA